TVLLPKMNKWIHSNGTRLAKTLTVEADPRVTAMLDDNAALARVWEAETGPWAALGLLGVVTRAHTFQCEKNLAETELLEFLKKEKFDLGISEVFDACGLAIFDEIGLEKHVIMQTALLPEKVAQAFGIPNLPSLVPAYYSDAPMEWATHRGR
uniref:glucuronosyltransferase n=1 Tax=Steinernema glaseri TaxID=37863 RepID=A0A1I8ARP2_9BILA